MAKNNSLFMCSDCGNEFPKWTGQCPICRHWNTLAAVDFALTRPTSSRKGIPAVAITPAQALSDTKFATFPTNISELDRVLGPGLTKGGVYLLAGEPGIGKSTLLTQLAISIASNTKEDRSVLYVCSEENPSQVGSRISRLSAKSKANEHIHLLPISTIEDIIDYTNKAPQTTSLIIVDSIQSVISEAITGTAGTLTQIRACTNLLIHLAKTSSIPIILVGHVTKSGEIAGPKLLEHMVDAVLQLEGDRHYDLRLLRGAKNRFGPTDETGIFQMQGDGLIPLTDPSKYFLTSRPTAAPGSALTLIMEGTRPLVVEIQALTVDSELAIPRRVAQGLSTTKLQLICAILTKHLHLKLAQKDVFVNVTGGLNLREPAADLAIALAVLSSFKNLPLPDKSLAVGELGLLGEIRPVSYQDKRLKEALNLGYSVPFQPLKTNHLKAIRF